MTMTHTIYRFGHDDNGDPYAIAEEAPMPTPTPCKCYVSWGKDIVYCPLHAQAPAMLDMLRAIVLRWSLAVDREGVTTFPARAYLEDARALLRAVEG